MQELDLEKIRQEIDKVDQQLADVLESRLQLVMQVAAYKKSKGLPVKDKNREAKVIEKVAGFLENKEYSVAVKNIMRGIIDQACLLEETALSEANNKTYEVACFGPAGRVPSRPSPYREYRDRRDAQDRNAGRKRSPARSGHRHGR